MADIESPLYRVNRFVSALKVCMPETKIVSHLAGAFALTVEDLEAVVRENYELREAVKAARAPICQSCRTELALGKGEAIPSEGPAPK